MHGHGTPYTAADFARNPMMLYYEVTRACDLVCKHCRASAQETAAPDELAHADSMKLISDVAKFPRKPTICFTGGDPLKRADLFELIQYATDLGITTALTPSSTPLATYDAFKKAKEAGVSAIGLSIDGPNAEVHDAFRGFEGSFSKAMEMLAYARDLELPVQVNTSITRRNWEMVDAIADLVEEKGATSWSVFFLVPVGRGVEEIRISPPEYRQVFARLYENSLKRPFFVRTTEAPHYRRYVLDHGGEWRGVLGVIDGRGVMFVGHNGEIYPAGFLPVLCGRFPQDSVVDVYQNNPVFRALRDPEQLKGRCGKCKSRQVCGGSRARAYAVNGDYLAEEPDCDFDLE
jgi:radical SAM protein with 4Fe4S-binding SPASM domain